MNRYHKSKGMTAFEWVLMLLAAGCLFMFAIQPYLNTQTLNEMRDKAPSVTIADKKLIDRYLGMSVPEIQPDGIYYGYLEIDGKELRVTLSFDSNETVTIEMVILDKYKLSGTANFSFTGSTLVYSNIRGDKALFPKIGQAITVRSKDHIIFYEPEMTIDLKSSYLLEQEKTSKMAVEKMASETLDKTSYSQLELEEMLTKFQQSPYISFFMVLIFLSLFPIIVGGYKKVRDGK